MADKTELTADVVKILGGKLGHIANSLNWNKKLAKYNNIVIIGGTNNTQHDGETLNTSKDEVCRGWHKINDSVKDFLESSKTKKLIAVETIKSPSCDDEKIMSSSDVLKISLLKGKSMSQQLILQP